MTWYVIKFTIKTKQKYIINNFNYDLYDFEEKYFKKSKKYLECTYEQHPFNIDPFTNSCIYWDCPPLMSEDTYKWKVLISSDDYNKETFKETLKRFINDYNKKVADENKIRITNFRVHEMMSYDKTKFVENIKLD